MSRSIGPALPRDLLELLDGHDIEGGVGRTFLLLTTDDKGWVSVALLSVGEVLATGPSEVRLALWPGTTSVVNMARTTLATLGLMHAGDGWYIRLRVRRDDDIRVAGMSHSTFTGSVEDVLHDAVTYARITSGIAFELPEPEPVLARWRATIARLRAVG